MTLLEHIARANEQLESGTKIGRRQTPVISFWPMRDKWKKYGEAWMHVGTDGDIIQQGKDSVVPATLQLVYFTTPQSLVCQLAYVTEPESVVPMQCGQEGIDRINRYSQARNTLPISLDKTTRPIA